MNDYSRLQKLISNLLDSPATGGNVSVKMDNGMIIKSSGTDLKKEESFVFVDENEICTTEFGKPSMEYEFHKIIPYKYVIHYHPIYVLPFLCFEDSSKFLEHEFSSILDFSVLEYRTPGKELALEIEKNNNKKVYFLKNHGIIISDNEICAIENTYALIKERMMGQLKFFKFVTPDEFVLNNHPEIILYHWAIQGIMNYNPLNYLNRDKIDELDKSSNEKYRREIYNK